MIIKKRLMYENFSYLHCICFVPNCLFVTIIAKRTSTKTVYLYESRSAKLSSQRDAPKTSVGKRVTIPMISILLLLFVFNLKNKTHHVIKSTITINKHKKTKRENYSLSIDINGSFDFVSESFLLPCFVEYFFNLATKKPSKLCKCG